MIRLCAGVSDSVLGGGEVGGARVVRGEGGLVVGWMGGRAAVAVVVRAGCEWGANWLWCWWCWCWFCSGYYIKYYIYIDNPVESLNPYPLEIQFFEWNYQTPRTLLSQC